MKRLVPLLTCLMVAACSDGDGFDPPPDVPRIRIVATAVWDPSGAWASIELFDGSNVPLAGATVSMRGEHTMDATEYPPGSGVYRIAPGELDWTRELGVEADAGARGYLFERRHAAPARHEIFEPAPFTIFGGNGFDVRWDETGEADAARVLLRRNDDHDDVGPDDGLQHVSGGYDQTTNEEFVEVRRWREFVPEDALPGSVLRLEVRNATGPLSVTD